MVAPSRYGGTITTAITARLDRLPWSRVHSLVWLGITRILDGLDVTLAGSRAPALQESSALRLSTAQIAALAISSGTISSPPR